MKPLEPWEARWAPYDEPTYQTALNYVQPDDVVLDIGAGDLRLTRQMAKIARRVYALERQPAILANQSPWPANMTVICADARNIPWPPHITVGVLMMRHCTHFAEYGARLRQLGCHRLITNARWGMDVELMDFNTAIPWHNQIIGWYACWCGRVDFSPTSPAALTEAHLEQVTQVTHCPICSIKPLANTN
jgi:hypothetical protein